MKHHASSRSELLLMELLLAIFFFAVASAICLQLFAKAHHLSKDTERLNLAVTQTNTIDAILSVNTDPCSQLEDLYPAGTFTPQTMDASRSMCLGQLGFDAALHPSTLDEAVLIMTLVPESFDSGLMTYSLTWTDLSLDQVIYQTELTYYQPTGKDVMP